jgi:hypothetical protein
MYVHMGRWLKGWLKDGSRAQALEAFEKTVHLYGQVRKTVHLYGQVRFRSQDVLTGAWLSTVTEDSVDSHARSRAPLAKNHFFLKTRSDT